MDSRAPAPIRYVHGNRLESLAARLASALAVAPLADPLAAETIVVPHPGMRRWLERELARHWGIAARLSFPLPGRLVWELMAALTGIPADPSPYAPERLALRILAVLPDAMRDRAAGLPRSLASDLDAPLAAWQFAVRMARRFDEYLVFRPDWPLAWESGRLVLPQAGDERWQADLWRRTRAGLQVEHRAALRERALATLRSDASGIAQLLPARLTVFGVPTMPPPALDLIAALAGRIEVTWYHLNPSADWWVDLRGERELAQMRAVWRRLGQTDRSETYEVGHPLLPAWGRVGREFLKLLHGRTDLSVHDEDAFESPGADSLLHWLQRGLLLLDPDHELPPALERATESVRVHACAGAQREVEVLHDALLDVLSTENPPALHEIVVMTPDLARYAPLVDAVFGGAPPERRIPYTIADQAFAQAHGLAGVFLTLLALPRGRLGAAEVLDWLRCDAIARRFGVDRAGLDLAQQWVAELGVRWGLDAESRRAAGLGDFDDGCWRHALDRLLLGAATGPVDGLVGGVRPWTDLEGGMVQTAGALARCVETLAHWRARLARARTASEWATTGRELIADCFDESDKWPADAAALNGVREALHTLAEDAKAAGAQALALDHAVLLDALTERLQAPSPRQRYPGAGVTVCAMVPMRNVPFRVVCLLGLDDARFPRRDRDDGHHLMALDPRDGDRSLREDDRYLFLEAVLAARDRLILSYTARNPRDGAEQPPSPLVDELLDFLVRAWPEATAKTVRATLVHAAPERACDAAGFEQPASASFAAEWLPSARAAAGATPDADASAWSSTVPNGGDVGVEALLKFVRHPARDFARRALGLKLEYDSPVEPSESFALDGLGKFLVDERLIEAIAAGADGDDALMPVVRSEGLLPAGHAAHAAFGDALVRAHAFVQAWRDGPGLRGGQPPIPLDVRVGGWRVRGSLPDLDRGRVVVVRPSNWYGSQWMTVGLGAALAHLAGADDSPAWALERAKGVPVAWRLDPALLPAHWLADVLALWARAGVGPVPLWRKASWAFAEYADVDLDRARKEALKTWSGDYIWDGECDDDATAVAARAYDDPLGPEFEELAVHVLGPLLQARTPADV